MDWREFLAYYGGSRRATLTKLRTMLRPSVDLKHRLLHRDDFAGSDLSGIARSAFNYLLGPFRKSWHFSDDELAFLYAKLTAFENLLGDSTQPANASAVELRMDLYTCGWILFSRLIGLRDFAGAGQVEFFGQPDWYSKPVRPLSDIERLLDYQEIRAG